MKARYHNYDRSKSPHYLKNCLISVWLMLLSLLTGYAVFGLMSDNKQLSKDVSFIKSKPKFCKSYVKNKETGLVSLFDTTGSLCCIFIDSINIIEDEQR